MIRNFGVEKYEKVIKPLFPERKKRKARVGKGCMLKNATRPQMAYKSVNKAGKINYTYWDDPNELVDRLRILVASKSVGHTGHENEMISIIEELREAKIIK